MIVTTTQDEGCRTVVLHGGRRMGILDGTGRVLSITRRKILRTQHPTAIFQTKHTDVRRGSSELSQHWCLAVIQLFIAFYEIDTAIFLRHSEPPHTCPSYAEVFP